MNQEYVRGAIARGVTTVSYTHLDVYKRQDASKPYYITYRTHNQGQGTYYPFVTSRENDYAGSAGKMCIRDRS